MCRFEKEKSDDSMAYIFIHQHSWREVGYMRNGIRAGATQHAAPAKNAAQTMRLGSPGMLPSIRTRPSGLDRGLPRDPATFRSPATPFKGYSIPRPFPTCLLSVVHGPQRSGPVPTPP